MNRRGFLNAILATGTAPVILRVAWLMPLRVLTPAITYDLGRLVSVTQDLTKAMQRFNIEALVLRDLGEALEKEFGRHLVESWERADNGLLLPAEYT